MGLMHISNATAPMSLQSPTPKSFVPSMILLQRLRSLMVQHLFSMFKHLDGVARAELQFCGRFGRNVDQVGAHLPGQQNFRPLQGPSETVKLHPTRLNLLHQIKCRFGPCFSHSHNLLFC